jgi:CRP-like cAMP-binding protein
MVDLEEHLVRDRAINGQSVENLVLLGIPEKEFSILAPYLDHVGLENGAVLEREGARIDEVYFLNRGVALMIVETIEGKSVEVGLIGRGSMVGLQVAAGMEDFTHGVAMLTPGDAFRVKVDALQDLLPSMPKLRRMLLRRLAIRSVELAQNAACNRIHAVKERISRLLLQMHSRLDTDLISATHVALSKMVGTDRPTVTLTLAALEKDGAIEAAGHGSIGIANRKKLEKQACACYLISKRFDAELGLKT